MITYLSASALSVSTSPQHFSDVLPWLDLVYYRQASTSSRLSDKQLASAVDDLISQAIMQFGTGTDVWTRELSGHLFVLFRPAEQEPPLANHRSY